LNVYVEAEEETPIQVFQKRLTVVSLEELETFRDNPELKRYGK
jgi:hypothetical protein